MSDPPCFRETDLGDSKIWGSKFSAEIYDVIAAEGGKKILRFLNKNVDFQRRFGRYFQKNSRGFAARPPKRCDVSYDVKNLKFSQTPMPLMSDPPPLIFGRFFPEGGH